MTASPNVSTNTWRVTRPDTESEPARDAPISWVDQLPEIPQLTGVLGLSGDKMPVLLDLQDERPGALLICGDPGSGKTRLLQSLLCSLLAFNNPRQVQFALIADNLDPWRPVLRGLQVARYGLAVTRAVDEQARRWINRLAELVRFRRAEETSGPAILLLVDGFQHLPLIEPEVRWQLEWLTDAGPYVGIWPVASVNAQAARKLSDSLSHFGTRIYGRIADQDLRTQLAGSDLPEPGPADEQPFFVPIGGQWLKFFPPA